MKPSSPKTAVLLASYNGQQYLAAQLDSILQQTIPPDLILIRDDGSNDGTLEILRHYQSNNSQRIQLITGSNLGFVGNFFHLLNSVPLDFDYYLFADQDDVWLSDKIECSLLKLGDSSTSSTEPKLYFSRLQLVDSDLAPLGLSPLAKRLGFGNALFENPVTGCTIAINSSFLSLLRQHSPRPELVVAHDWWCYLLACAFGHIYFDPRARILYRQHGSNSMGGHPSGWGRLYQRIKAFRQGKWAQRRPEPMIEEFARVFTNKLTSEQHQLIRVASKRQSGFWQAFSLWRKGLIWRVERLDHMILLFLLMRRPQTTINSAEVL